MAITNDDFKAALGRFASGVTVVTTKDSDGRLHGLTVSAFCSVSMEPPLILICVQKNVGSHHAVEESGVFVVNILSEAQADISDQFAYRQDDKFEGISFQAGIDGLPVLDDCIVNLECRLKSSFDGGDHTIFIGEIETATIRDREPLVYFCGNYKELEG